MEYVFRGSEKKNVPLIVLVNNIPDLSAIVKAITTVCGRDIACEGYKDVMNGYMIEVVLTYTQYNSVNRELDLSGYKLERASSVGILYKLHRK